MSQSSEQNNPATQDTMSRSNGRVKWFNNKHGYGFLTCGSGDKKDEDVFVHHTALTTSEEQYRYLVQGEYVEFTWSTSEGNDHEWQATNVTGMNGGKLMCETRNDSRQMTQSTDNENENDTQQKRRPRRNENSRTNGPPHRIRGGGPREDDVEWKLVPIRREKSNGSGNGGGKRLPRPRNNDTV